MFELKFAFSYEPFGKCFFNMDIQAGSDEMSTTCYLVATSQEEFVFATFDVIVLNAPAECPIPYAPENGDISCSGLAEGSVCNFSCNDGYRMNGEATINCMDNSGTKEWDNTEPRCEKIQLAKCRGAGDPHYTTFDGWYFDFMGTCEYTFSTFGDMTTGVGTYADGSTGPAWRVTVENYYRNGITRVSYLKKARLYLNNAGTETLFEFVADNLDVSVNGVQMFTPFITSDISIETVGTQLKITMLKYEFVLTIQKRFIIELEVGERYADLLDGMCGDFDGVNDRRDDQGEQRKGHEWGNSHLYQATSGNQGCDAVEYIPPANPTIYDENCQCGSAKASNTDGLFYSCLSRAVSTQAFADAFANLYDNCQHDANEMDTDEQRAKIFEDTMSEVNAICANLYVENYDSSQNGYRATCFPNSDIRTCPPNSHWTSCGSACPLTCADKPGVPKFCTRQCVEQCACDAGYVLSGKECVPLRQCGCQSEKFGGYFTLGYKFRPKSCDERKEYTCTTPFGELDEVDLGACPAKTQCVDGECVPDTIGYCRGTGDPHYQTFDGLRYDFMGLCINRFVTVATDHADLGPELPPFEIRTKHRHAWAPRTTKVAMTEWVWVDVWSKTQNTDYSVDPMWTILIRIVDSPGDRVGAQRGKGRPTGVKIIVTNNILDATFDSEEIMNADFHARVLNGNLVVIDTWFGLQVKFGAHNWGLEIFVPSTYQTMTAGLCGNFNGNKADDYNGPDDTTYTSLVDMAHSWRHDSSDDGCPKGEVVEKCPNNAENKPVYDACEPIQNESSIFAQCIPDDLANLQPGEVDPEGYYDECVFDYCIETSPEMLCSMYDNYASACLFQMAQDNLIDLTNKPAICDWATNLNCAPQCPDPNMTYRGCVDPCRDIQTCATQGQEIECPAKPMLVSMCVCNPGFVQQGNRCVQVEECGCNVPNKQGELTGVWVKNGYEFMEPDCKTIRRCQNNVFEYVRGTYEAESHCNDVTQRCVKE